MLVSKEIMTYIDRYRDKHLSYHSDKYTCTILHNTFVDKTMIKLENHYLSIDRLYYHLIANKRLCCIDLLLDEKKYPSTFCIVRAYKYDYDTGKYIDERLPLHLRAAVFNRMAERLILIRDIKRHITRYRPQLWSMYCGNAPWSKMKKYISDEECMKSLDSIYRITNNAISTASYKYDDIPDVVLKYDGFKSVLDEFNITVSTFNRKIIPNETILTAVRDDVRRNLKKETKEYLAEYLNTVISSVVFYTYVMKWAPYYSMDKISEIVEKTILEIVLSDMPTPISD